MALPKVVYDAGAGPVTLQFARGPQNFKPYFASVIHDNEATSGARERVTERNDLLLSFSMGYMRVDDDLAGWSAFMAWALGGGQFSFYPNAALADYYTCVSEDEGFEPALVAPGIYGAAFVWRVWPDARMPAGPGVVLARFYGIAG
jgi:hypothetical protein